MAALSGSGYDGQTSGRVRDVPDVRTIRYYTTLGLIDRPAQMEGRTAYYSQRHLLQLVAIKRLQAQGLSLVDVQKQLLGSGDAKLAELADLSSTANDKPVEPESSPRTAFWAQPPEVKAAAPDVAPPSSDPTPAMILPLGEGLSLLIEDADATRLDRAAMQSLAPAVANLRAALRKAGVIAGDAELRTGGGDTESATTGHPQ